MRLNQMENRETEDKESKKMIKKTEISNNSKIKRYS